MDDTQRFTKIKEDINQMSDQKIRLEERFKTEKANLEKLLTEINEKGYDPKKLTEIREEKEKQLEKLLGELETQVQETQEKLNLIEV
jgi:hypothetical protein